MMQIARQTDGQYAEDARRIQRDYNITGTTRDEIRQQLEDADFSPASIEDVAGWIVTVDDLDLDSAHLDQITTQEDIRDALDDADTVGMPDSHKQRLVQDASSRVGAPTRAEKRDRMLEAIERRETITPEGSSATDEIIRDMNGEAVVIQTRGGRNRDVRGQYEQTDPDLVDAAVRDSGDLFDEENYTVEPAPDGRRGMLYFVADDGTRHPMTEVDIT